MAHYPKLISTDSIKTIRGLQYLASGSDTDTEISMPVFVIDGGSFVCLFTGTEQAANWIRNGDEHGKPWEFITGGDYHMFEVGPKMEAQIIELSKTHTIALFPYFDREANRLVFTYLQFA